MSGLVHRVVGWLPPSWQTAIERESREWRARCPRCLQEVSVWELGGVRFKAAGNPCRKARCPHCATSFVGQFYFVGAPADDRRRANEATERHGVGPDEPPTPVRRGRGIADALPLNGSTSAAGSRCRLWIDGAGCYLLQAGETITIGSPSAGPERPEVAIMAAISRRHVQITRKGEGFILESLSPAAGASRLLRSGETFSIGGGVELRLRVPNPLSHTALLEIVSAHRTEPRVDGILLLDQVCVLGGAADSHIQNARWPSPLILFRREQALWCKAVPGLRKNGEPVTSEVLLDEGAVLSTDDLRLRIELSCGLAG